MIRTHLLLGATLALSLFTLPTHPAFAQTPLNAFHDTAHISFTGFDGQADPPDWSTSGISNDRYQGYSTGSSTAGGLYSFGTDADGTDTDRWLGVQFASDPDTATLSTSFSNQTGDTIDSLQVSYQAYQFRAANDGRASFFDVTLDNGDPLPELTFLSDPTLPTGQRGENLGDTASPTLLSATLSDLSIPDGDSFTLHWQGDRGDGSGFAQGIGITNIQVSPVPEPGTLALLSLAAFASLLAHGCTSRK